MSEIFDKMVRDAIKALPTDDYNRAILDLRYFGNCIIGTDAGGQAKRIDPRDFYETPLSPPL